MIHCHFYNLITDYRVLWPRRRNLEAWKGWEIWYAIEGVALLGRCWALLGWRFHSGFAVCGCLCVLLCSWLFRSCCVQFCVAVCMAVTGCSRLGWVLDSALSLWPCLCGRGGVRITYFASANVVCVSWWLPVYCWTLYWSITAIVLVIDSAGTIVRRLCIAQVHMNNTCTEYILALVSYT